MVSSLILEIVIFVAVAKPIELRSEIHTFSSFVELGKVTVNTERSNPIFFKCDMLITLLIYGQLTYSQAAI